MDESCRCLDLDGFYVVVYEDDLRTGQHQLSEEASLLGQSPGCLPDHAMDRLACHSHIIDNLLTMGNNQP